MHQVLCHWQLTCKCMAAYSWVILYQQPALLSNKHYIVSERGYGSGPLGMVAKDSRALWLVDGTPHVMHDATTRLDTVLVTARATPLLLLCSCSYTQCRCLYGSRRVWHSRPAQPNPTAASTSSQGQSCLLCPHHVPLSIHDPCICVHGQAARATHHYPLMIHSWEITMIIVYDNIS